MVKKKLTESQVAKTYEIVNTFSDDKQNGKVFESGGFVTKEDFAPETWKTLLSDGDIRPVAPEEPLKEDEVIIFQKVEE